MAGATITFLLCWGILILALFGRYSWRAFRMFHKTLGTWTTVWTVLLITWTMWLQAILMAIGKILPHSYNAIANFISMGITRGIYAIMPALIAPPVVGRHASFSCIIMSFAFLIVVGLSSIITFPIPCAIVIHRFLKRTDSYSPMP